MFNPKEFFKRKPLLRKANAHNLVSRLYEAKDDDELVERLALVLDRPPAYLREAIQDLYEYLLLMELNVQAEGEWVLNNEGKRICSFCFHPAYEDSVKGQVWFPYCPECGKSMKYQRWSKPDPQEKTFEIDWDEMPF